MSDATTTPVTDRIVVGIDGSDPSQLALRWAASLSKASGGSIVAVGAWYGFDAYQWAGYGYAPMPADWNPANDVEKVVIDTLDQVFGADRPADLEVVVREGPPTRVLLDISRDARMLVLGSRGHGGFAGLLLGSVSSACSQHAACPVLVVHGDTLPPDLAGV